MAVLSEGQEWPVCSLRHQLMLLSGGFCGNFRKADLGLVCNLNEGKLGVLDNALNVCTVLRRNNEDLFTLYFGYCHVLNVIK